LILKKNLLTNPICLVKCLPSFFLSHSATIDRMSILFEKVQNFSAH